MFIFWSSHKKIMQNTLNYTILSCEVCEQEQPFSIHDLSQEDSIYSIKVSTTKLKKLAVCEMCGNTKEIRKDEDIKCTNSWHYSDGINPLALELGYSLAEPDKLMVNDNTLMALSKRVAKTKINTDMNSVSWKAGVAGILLGILLAWFSCVLYENGLKLTKNIDAFGHGMLAAIAGFVIGMVIVSILEFKRNHRITRKHEIEFYLGKHGVELDSLKKLVEGLPSVEYKTKEFINSL